MGNDEDARHEWLETRDCDPLEDRFDPGPPRLHRRQTDDGFQWLDPSAEFEHTDEELDDDLD